MKYTILTLILLFFFCCKQEPVTPSPCKCDLLDEKEKYFVKSGNLVKTNTNKKALRQGKEAEVEISLNTDPVEIKNKLSKVEGNVKLKVPLIDFDKYEYEYQINMDESPNDRDMLSYFLAYCSFYSSYHKKNNNCEPDNNWKDKVEELRMIYLTPENSGAMKKKIENRNNVSNQNQTLQKTITASGKIMNKNNTDIGIPNVKIYLGESIVGESNQAGDFYVTLKFTADAPVQLRFESRECGSELYNLPKNQKVISNIPILLSCN